MWLCCFLLQIYFGLIKDGFLCAPSRGSSKGVSCELYYSIYYCFEGVTNEFGLLILYFKSKPVSLSAVKILNPNQLFHACFMYYHLLLPGSCFSLSFIQLSQTYLSCHCISPALYLQIIFWLFELVDHDIFVMLHAHCRAVSFWFSLFSKSVILYVHWRSLCMLKD